MHRELVTCEGFGQRVSPLAFSAYMLNYHLAPLDKISNKMETDVDVFRLFRAQRILAELNDTNIVLEINNWGILNAKTQKFQHLAYGHDVLRGFREANVFGLIGRGINTTSPCPRHPCYHRSPVQRRTTRHRFPGLLLIRVSRIPKRRQSLPPVPREVSPRSLVPFRYSRTLITAFQCSAKASCSKHATMRLALAMSGRIVEVSHIRPPSASR